MIDRIETSIETNEGFVRDHIPTNQELSDKLNELIDACNRLAGALSSLRDLGVSKEPLPQATNPGIPEKEKK